MTKPIIASSPSTELLFTRSTATASLFDSYTDRVDAAERSKTNFKGNNLLHLAVLRYELACVKWLLFEKKDLSLSRNIDG